MKKPGVVYLILGVALIVIILGSIVYNQINKEPRVQVYELGQIKSQCEEVDFVFASGNYSLIKVNPAMVEYWFSHYSSIDDREWSKEEGYVCLDFAVDSANQWQNDFSNCGLYLANSNTGFHKFNAVFVGGDPLDISSWTFLEPQWGKVINIDFCTIYSFPIAVDLSYEPVFSDTGKLRGINPYLTIVWKAKNKKGILGYVDKAGNFVPY